MNCLHLIFSKDRALQLKSQLESIKKFVKGPIKHVVLFTHSPHHEKSYQEVVEEFSKDFRFFCEILSKIRHEKTKAQKSMNSEIILTLSKENIKALKNMKEDFKSVTNSKEIKEGRFKVDFI